MLEKAKEEKDMTKLSQEEKASNDTKLWSGWLKLYRERLAHEIKDLTEANDIQKFEEERKRLMDSINPRFILRNYMAQEAIQAAEEGNFSMVRDLLGLLQNPYSDISNQQTNEKEESIEDMPTKYACSAPSWAIDLRVT